MSSQWQLRSALDALHAGARRLREIDPDIIISVSDDLAEEAATVEAAIVAVCRAAREAEALAKSAKEMAKEIAGRGARFDTRGEQLRGVAFAALDALGVRKIEAPDLTVSLRAGQPLVMITDETKVPDEYWKVTRSIDKNALRDDLKQGVVIDGAELTNGMPSIMVRGT